MIDVFEESVLNFSATVVRGKAKAKKVLVKFTQVGGATTLANGEVPLATGLFSSNRQTAQYSVTLPLVADTEDSYTLSYEMSYDGKPLKSAEYKVWPRAVRIKATRENGPQNVWAYAPLKCSQASKDDRRQTTSTTGISVFHPLAPAAVTVTPESPFVLDRWVTPTGRNREVVLKRLPYKAVFFSHTPATTALKQYVNLPSLDTAPTQGQVVHVIVGAEGDKAKDVPARIAIQGDEIFVKVIFDATNSKRNSPKPGLVIAGAEVAAEPDGCTFKGKVRLNGRREGLFDLRLGYAGGDGCEVHIGVTDACNDVATPLKFTNVRKLYYQLTLPAGATAPSLGRITTALADVGVEYEQSGATVTLAEDSGPAGSWFPGAWVKETSRKCINIGDTNKDHFHAKFTDAKTPLMVHVLGCDTQYDCASPECLKDFLNVEVTSASKTMWSDGSQPIGVHMHVGGSLFPKSMKDGTAVLKSGTWTEVGGTGTGTITEADIWVDLVTNPNWLFVKLPNAAKAIVTSATGKKVTINLQVFVPKGPYLGEADGTKGWLQLIVTRGAAKMINDVMAHELGHTLNQVTKSVAPGLTATDHGRLYNNNGHQGPHCADGMSDDHYNGGAGEAGSAYAGAFGGKAECTCIMYGENGDNSTCTGHFCTRCQPFLKAEQLTTLH